ncbi:MAG TPA: hypothetical protein VNJ12_13410 [Candidatus Dormibacteraeota bacterium]|nr:hypothetical protein [Candidatus Dormibacteraeota bacterium]
MKSEKRQVQYPWHSLKNRSWAILGALFLLFAAVPSARAQFIGYNSPQSVQQIVFNGSCAPGTVNVTNLGQTVHILSYTTTGAGNFDIRLEGSNDGTTFFPISDDATVPGQGVVYAIGYYPVVRANLVSCDGGTIKASYVGSSASPTPSAGDYNPSQSILKVVGMNIPEGSNFGATLPTSPFGSSLGYLIANSNGAGFPSGSSLSVSPLASTFQVGYSVLTPLSMSTAVAQTFGVSSSPATAFSVSYTSGGVSGATFDLYYLFVNPSVPTGLSDPTAQPLTTYNLEATATGAAAGESVGYGGVAALRGFLYSVSARCSAGTAQITVTDGTTQIWSTGPAEVGTTTFHFSWDPGLASTLGSRLTVTLSSCGAGNTGTLDVQASQF